MTFYSIYRQGFVRVAACAMPTTIGEPAANGEVVLQLARDCHENAVAVAVFPELTLSGYSIDDIVRQDTLLDAVEDALRQIVVGTSSLLPILVVGAPLRYRHRIYNCAVLIHRGAVYWEWFQSPTCRHTASFMNGAKWLPVTIYAAPSLWPVPQARSGLIFFSRQPMCRVLCCT